ncbi:MAG: SMC-Scp complex subunit ScpB [Rhodospirillaceae bacterium]|nr:SMC-Scp complex subunit ScpB [Rhodospirillaceae bacterium]
MNKTENTSNTSANADDAEIDFEEMENDSVDDIDKQKTENVDPEHVRLLEAALFASSAPVGERVLSRRLPDGANIKQLLKVLREFYEGRGVNLVRRGGLWAFRTAADLGAQLNVEVDVGRKLSRAAIETLAIIAYHQPVTRGEIEEIRGVSLSKGTLDLLFDEGWIKPRGRRDVPGHPMQWGTTDEFLDHFALESVKDLPGLQELRSMGLLDARPALEAYSVRGEVGARSGEGGEVEISESIVVRAERSDEDYDASVDDEGNGETGIMASSHQAEATAVSKDREEKSMKTSSALDDAMGAVADAVKSAAQAIERETQDPDEDEQD